MVTDSELAAIRSAVPTSRPTWFMSKFVPFIGSCILIYIKCVIGCLATGGIVLLLAMIFR